MGPVRIILASQSPRRRELLERMGILNFEIIPARGEEVLDPALPPERLVEELSRQKAAEVAAGAVPEDLVIAADTVVAVDGKILGKPQDTKDAARMLRLLSGRTHQVLTGVALFYRGQEKARVDVTEVTFAPLTDQQIAWYIGTGEPLDKAGAYGIQGKAALFIPTIHGSYSNVVGLPLATLLTLFAEMDVMQDDTLFDQGNAAGGTAS